MRCQSIKADMAQISSREKVIYFILIGVLVLGALGGGTYALVKFNQGQKAETSVFDVPGVTKPPISAKPPAAVAPAPTPTPTPTPAPTPTPTPTPAPAPTTRAPTPTPRVTTPVTAAPRATTTPTSPSTAVSTATNTQTPDLTVANGDALPEASPEAGISSGVLLSLAALTSLALMAVFTTRQLRLEKIINKR
jgi:outer membrane biosynthesis protein TonB